jgi:hypothetical protein
VPLDGYANGWLVGPGCRTARFTFDPQHVATASYAFSVAAGIVLLLVALGVRVRRGARRLLPQRPRWVPLGTVAPLRLDWAPAIALALALGTVGSALGLRVGLALAVLALVLAREGATPARLIAIAAIGFAALPAIYLAKQVSEQGGLSFTFPSQHLTAHWIGIVALWCLGGAAVLQARALRALSVPRHANDAVPGQQLPDAGDPADER